MALRPGVFDRPHAELEQPRLAANALKRWACDRFRAVTRLSRNMLAGAIALGTLLTVSTAVAGIGERTRFSARVARTNGTATTPFKQAPQRWVPMALSSFSFRFADGAHAVQALELLPGSRGVTTTFAESGEDRPYAFDATFVAVPGAEEYELSETCTETCTLELPRPVGPDEALALGGFSLRRTDADTEIETFAIRPDLRRSEVEVEFGGADDLPYEVELRVLYVDQAQVTRAIELRGGGNGGTRVVEGPEADGPQVLHGFDLRFQRGAHHLRGVMVRLGQKARVRLDGPVDSEPVDVRLQSLVLRAR